MKRAAAGVGMFLDKVLDTRALSRQGLAALVVLALLGAWLAIQGVVHWRAGEREADREHQLQQKAMMRSPLFMRPPPPAGPYRPGPRRPGPRSGRR